MRQKTTRRKTEPIPPIRVGAKVTYTPAGTGILGREGVDYAAKLEALFDKQGDPVEVLHPDAAGSATVRLSNGTVLEGVPKKSYMNEPNHSWCRPYITSMTLRFR